MIFEDFRSLASPYADVSHETFIRLEAYVNLLKEWQAKINLVSDTTLDTIWDRHVFDSLTVLPQITEFNNIADFGTGAGLPGMIVAMVTGKPIVLVESDQRKAAFLYEASRATQTPVKIVNKRVEHLDRFMPFEAIIARAFAPLVKLLAYTSPWLQNGTQGIFIKGRDAQLELDQAALTWRFRHQIYSNLSQPHSTILIVSNLSPR